MKSFLKGFCGATTALTFFCVLAYVSHQLSEVQELKRGITTPQLRKIESEIDPDKPIGFC